MKIYMAPLEEVTEYIYRNAYHAFFSPMDKYFARVFDSYHCIKLHAKSLEAA